MHADSPSTSTASVATWILAAIVAAVLAGHTYRIPIQVPDSLELMQQMQTIGSMRDAFVEGLHSSATMLRPLRQTQTKLLLDVGEWLGGRYQVAFRGYHAGLVVVLVALFVALARVATWTDAAACVAGLVVLVGTHTFSGLLREAYPVNHFLLVAIYSLVMLGLAFTRGGWMFDVAAAALLVTAVLTLESGVLVWVVAVAAYASGLRGLSRRAIVGLSLLCAGYLVFRFGYLNVSVPALGDRPTAIGIVELTAGEQVARFGGHPMALYLYNSLTSILSVLLSQPRAGRWTVAEAVARGDVPPVFYVELLSSIAASALVAWYITGRDSQGRRRWREPIPLVFVSVLLANGAISYSYTKNEIVSVSGVLYALTLTVAIRHVLMVRGRARLLVPLALGLLLFNVAWAMRAAGLQAVLLRAAFSARSEWASVLMPGEPSQWPTDGRTLALTKLLKEQAISTRGISAAELPRWAQRWWGEE